MNARAKTWDKKYNARGYILEEWVAKNELVVMNDGKTETCVRAQGSSMVDFGTEAAMKVVKAWEVDVNTETLSDHKYIRIKIDSREKGNSFSGGIKFPRWNIKKIDKDWFTASVVGDWLAEQRIKKLLDSGEIDKAENIDKSLITDACDNAMIREKIGEKRKDKVYWWNNKIAKLRDRCSMWRRILIRAKGRKSLERVSQLAGELKNNRKELRKAIGKAKREAWDELLERLNKDPWGQPYKVVMNKIRSENVNTCGKLPEKTIEEILGKLFPKDRGTNICKGNRSNEEDLIPATTAEELGIITKKTIRKGKKASGPDGIQARLVAEAHQCAEATYRGLYDGCLRKGSSLTDEK